MEKFSPYKIPRFSQGFVDGRSVDDYPLVDEKIFKLKDQRDVVLNFVSSKAPNEKNPDYP
ncbi:MAG: hypothetical protein ACI9P7_000595 [Candidatus Azotimanducaceae bacterium]|jgi:hypothetical protein